MILGHGIDLVNIERFREVLARQGDHFEARVFSESERAYCKKKKDPAPHFAARFAAKEAYGKALGLGMGPTGNLNEIEVRNDEQGAPSLHLKASAQEFFLNSGAKKIFLSLSHDGGMAMASVILSSEGK